MAQDDWVKPSTLKQGKSRDEKAKKTGQPENRIDSWTGLRQ